MTDRYARQMVLPEVGPAGQARLAAARVLVVGAGGLGSPVLATLAGAGVGHLTILDHDRVEESNLHRQPLYRMADLGRLKAEAARDALLAANPSIAVDARPVRLGVGNAPGLVADADLVLDCADSLAATYVLSDACHAQRKPLVSASVLGLSGYVGAFCGGVPSYRAVFPDMPAHRRQLRRQRRARLGRGRAGLAPGAHGAPDPPRPGAVASGQAGFGRPAHPRLRRLRLPRRGRARRPRHPVPGARRSGARRPRGRAARGAGGTRASHPGCPAPEPGRARCRPHRPARRALLRQRHPRPSRRAPAGRARCATSPSWR